MIRRFNNKIFSFLDILIIKYQILKSTVFSKISLKFQHCIYGKNFRTSGKCFFKANNSESIIFGDRVSLFSAHRTNRIGLTNPTLIQTLDNGKIYIGNDSGLSSVVISSRTKIKIGDRVKIGANTKILDHDFHSLSKEYRSSCDDNKYIKSKPIIIKNDVFIGVNSIILKGVEIGNGVIIGAGSVVTMNKIPSNVIVAGNPAKIVKKLNYG